ncbi:hypothetical protein H4582DRAFT_1999115 [Lactarius indigo]|nr:hypothetical protein H4582DRAFT_1999115 [Lactarius indigo]
MKCSILLLELAAVGPLMAWGYWIFPAPLAARHEAPYTRCPCWPDAHASLNYVCRRTTSRTSGQHSREWASRICRLSGHCVAATIFDLWVESRKVGKSESPNCHMRPFACSRRLPYVSTSRSIRSGWSHMSILFSSETWSEARR